MFIIVSNVYKILISLKVLAAVSSNIIIWKSNLYYIPTVLHTYLKKVMCIYYVTFVFTEAGLAK